MKYERMFAIMKNNHEVVLNTYKYRDVVETFPFVLLKTITKGYGCGRKIESISHCNGGCRWMVLSLDESILNIKEDIETWFDQELACLQRR